MYFIEQVVRNVPLSWAQLIEVELDEKMQALAFRQVCKLVALAEHNIARVLEDDQ